MIRTLAHAAPYNLSDTAAAAAYAAMTHRPHNFTVEMSYLHFKHETIAQYVDLIAQGLDIVHYSDGDPYACKSAAMFRDVEYTGRVQAFLTAPDQGFPPDHPMLTPTGGYGRMITGEAFPLLLNDVFRAVHDINGHYVSRSSFGPAGEKTAWLTHRQTYTREALTALWCETRGQASWTNSHTELPQHDRPFAQQKCGLPDSDLI
jgi:hypothetical protein